jgi:hypothetical protein
MSGSFPHRPAVDLRRSPYDEILFRLYMDEAPPRAACTIT